MFSHIQSDTPIKEFSIEFYHWRKLLPYLDPILRRPHWIIQKPHEHPGGDNILCIIRKEVKTPLGVCDMKDRSSLAVTTSSIYLVQEDWPENTIESFQIHDRKIQEQCHDLIFNNFK